jgi:hypothetical protein
MFGRRRFNQTTSLHDRLSAFADDLRNKAAVAVSAVEREQLLKRARLADTTLHVDDWVDSTGLKPPE